MVLLIQNVNINQYSNKKSKSRIIRVKINLLVVYSKLDSLLVILDISQRKWEIPSTLLGISLSSKGRTLASM